MRLFLLIPVLIVVLLSCRQSNAVSRKADMKWIDSILKASDTSYSKKYRNNEFVQADYYINRKENRLLQLMRDSADRIRQVIVVEHEIRKYVAAYYPNGQLMADTRLDSLGKFDGPSTVYHENGRVKSEGKYQHGFFVGEWKNYDQSGKYLSTDQYDGNGQLVKTVPASN